MHARPSLKTVSALVIGATLFGGGVATASTTPSAAASPNPGPAPVQVTNFPATQNVGGSVNVGNFPATQNVAGTVSVGNLPTTQNVAGTVNIGNLPTTQAVSGSVSVSGGAVGVDPTQNTVQAQQVGTWTVSSTDETVPVSVHQYPNAGAMVNFFSVDAYRSVLVDAATPNGLPSGCSVTLTVYDEMLPDNTPGYGLGNVIASTTFTTAFPWPQWRYIVDEPAPRIELQTTDSPKGCASSNPITIGVYGRPN